jgi:hypothetical protein
MPLYGLQQSQSVPMLGKDYSALNVRRSSSCGRGRSASRVRRAGKRPGPI